MKEARVDALYTKLKEMAVSFRLKPGSRINEVNLAGELNASRTPLREALNRLTAEGFMRFEPGKGFFCRNLSIRDITDLYQLRIALELQGVKLAAKHASDGDLDELAAFLSRTSSHAGRSLEEVLSFDEYFHETIVSFSGNSELLKMLKMVNARIRFFRWVDMEARRPETQTEHGEILAALRNRDADSACRLMENHITRRSDQIAEAVKECHARIFIVEDFIEPVFVHEVAE